MGIFMKNLAYYLFISILVICKGFGFDMGDKLYLICALISLVLFCIKFFLTHWTLKEFIVVVSLCLIAGISAILSGKFAIVMAVLVVIASKEMNLCSVLKNISLIWIICFCCNTSLSLLGIRAEQVTYLTDGVGNIIDKAYGLGYGHKNQLAIATAVTYVSYLYYRFSKIRVIEFVLVSSYFFYICSYAKSDTGNLIMLVIALMYIFMNMKTNFSNKLVKLLIFAVPVCVLFSFGCSLLYGKLEIINIVDRIFNTRIRLGSKFLKLYPISLFGQKIVYEGNDMIDNGYISLYCHNGVFIFSALILGYYLAVKKLIKYNMRKELMLVVVFLCLGIVESFFANPFMNISIILVSLAIFKNIAIKNRVDRRYNYELDFIKKSI